MSNYTKQIMIERTIIRCLVSGCKQKGFYPRVRKALDLMGIEYPTRRCPFCGRRFSSSAYFAYHLIHEHGPELDEIIEKVIELGVRA